jgi:hypothetical protein
MGAAWGVVVAAMLATLLVLFVLRLRRSGRGSGGLIAIGVAIGLAVAGLAVVLSLAEQG